MILLLKNLTIERSLIWKNNDTFGNRNDHRAVEELTREAFWNVYKPGADEHYFVHKMRNHPDFIPELAFVLELDGKIVGSTVARTSMA